MADKKKKAPAKPIIGYGTNVKAGKKVAKTVAKKVTKGVAKAGTAYGKKAAKTGQKNFGSAGMVNRKTGRKEIIFENGQWIPSSGSRSQDALMTLGQKTKKTGILRNYEWGTKTIGAAGASKSLFERKAATAYNKAKAKKK